MKNKLTQEQLKSSLGDNYKYYAKYLEKFNNQGGLFFSWNWAAFLMTVPWAVYRKQWGTYLFYLFLTLFYVASYFIVVDDNRLRDGEALFYVISSVITLILVILQLITANYFVLRSVQSSAKERGSGMVTIIFFMLIMAIPSTFTTYDFYKNYKRDIDKKMLSWSFGGDSLYALEEKTTQLSSNNIDLLYQPIAVGFVKSVGCVGDVTLLKRLEKKGLDLGRTLIAHHALKCHNKNIAEYVIDNNKFTVNQLNLILEYAIESESFTLFQRLIKEYKLDETSGYLFGKVLRYNSKKKNRYMDLLLEHIPVNKTYSTYTKSQYHIRKDSALNIAIQYKHIDVIKRVLEKGADINWKYPKGETLSNHFFSAINTGDFEVIKLVLDRGFDVNQEYMDTFFEKQYDNYLDWFLQNEMSAYDKQKKIAILLINKVRRINAMSLQKMLDYELVTHDMLEKVDFKSFTKKEWKMLFEKSCRDNNLGLFNIFLEQGGKLEEYDFFTDKIWDCNYHTGLAKLLMKHNYDFNHYNTKDLVLVNYATKKREGYEEIIKILLQDKAFDLTIDYKGETILHRILRHLHSIKYPLLKEVLEALKHRGQLKQVINTKDSAGVAPIHITNNRDALELLIEYGANVTLETDEGYTVLNYIEKVEAFALVASYFEDNHPQKVKLNCTLKVRQTYDKRFQSACKAYASTIENVNKKSFYLFLAGEFEAIKALPQPKDIESSSTKYEHFYANLGHAYLLTGEFDRADMYYQKFIVNARKLYKFMYKTVMRNDFKTIQKLYGDKAHQEVTTVFDESYEKTLGLILNDVDNWNFITRHIVLNGDQVGTNSWRYQIGKESFTYNKDTKIYLEEHHPYFLSFNYREILFIDKKQVGKLGYHKHNPSFKKDWKLLNQKLLQEKFLCNYRKLKEVFIRLKEGKEDLGFEKVDYTRKHNFEQLEITHKGKTFLLMYYNGQYSSQLIWFDFTSRYDTWSQEEKREVKQLLCR